MTPKIPFLRADASPHDAGPCSLELYRLYSVGLLDEDVEFADLLALPWPHLGMHVVIAQTGVVCWCQKDK